MPGVGNPRRGARYEPEFEAEMQAIYGDSRAADEATAAAEWALVRAATFADFELVTTNEKLGSVRAIRLASSESLPGAVLLFAVAGAGEEERVVFLTARIDRRDD